MNLSQQQSLVLLQLISGSPPEYKIIVGFISRHKVKPKVVNSENVRRVSVTATAREVTVV